MLYLHVVECRGHILMLYLHVVECRGHILMHCTYMLWNVEVIY